MGRHVDCPECGQALLIVECKEGLAIEQIDRKPSGAAKAPRGKGGSTEKTARGGKTAPAQSAPLAPVAGAAPAFGSEPAPDHVAAPRAAGARRLVHWRRPIVFVAAATACLAAGLLTLTFFVRPAGTTSHNGSAGDEPADRDLKRPPDVAAAKVETDESPDDNQDQPRDESELRLDRIGAALLEYVEAEGKFPAGTVAAKGIAP
ncbi:MAG TPA: hypothetical protein VKU82_12825, partial [Planctomycetaceae bacterium]|nr:hypothetical protein [Planctomycetaceae bacterium]